MANRVILFAGFNCFTKRLTPKVFLVLASTLMILLVVKQYGVTLALTLFSQIFPINDNVTNVTELHEDIACVFPDIDPFKPDIMLLSGLDKQMIKCEGYMPDLTYVNGSRLEVNGTMAKNTTGFKFCRYQDIFMSPLGDKHIVTGKWSEQFITGVELPEKAEFLVAVCENNASETISKTYHAIIPKRQELAEDLSLMLKKRNALYNPKETLNVVMIGMDGVPRNHFMRAMNKTYKFLMDELGSFDLSMYTQVGINSYPNFVPLLTGSYDEEIRTWWHGSGFLDTFDLVWKEFEAAGYRTLFTEDTPLLGAFHFGKNGFKSPPTNYYSRPICVAMDKDFNYSWSGWHCQGNKPEINFHLEYVKSYLQTFKGHPLYAMYFMTRIPHDDVRNTKMADEITYEFYKHLRDSGVLNNTLLVSFSDHGIRFGPLRSTFNGLIESRAPYAIFTFPKWFVDKYPDVARSLTLNTKRLTTHFDTHATLRDLLYFKSEEPSPLRPGKHGSSLFQEIPKSRTCEDIPIPMEFCICGQSQIEDISKTTPLSAGLVDVVLKSINAKINRTLCEGLTLQEIVQVAVVKLTKVNKKDGRLFKVKFTTTPGGALYEGTITSKKCQDSELAQYFEALNSGKGSNNTLQVTVGKTIDRLNFYRGQADCEDDVTRKPFCYCRDIVQQHSTV